MSKKINCIMLVDDNPDDNFFHERVIRKHDFSEHVIVKQTGKEALEYLKAKDQNKGCHPDLIFLDINMPGMNGWEFLNEYKKLDLYFQGKIIVVMLTSSDNPEDIIKAKEHGVAFEFKTKPLTKEMLDEIMEKYSSAL
jgi:CheY-like chemotaxis protein